MEAPSVSLTWADQRLLVIALDIGPGRLLGCHDVEAQVVIEDWRTDYNTRRPHSSLGQQPPAVYAANYRTNHP